MSEFRAPLSLGDEIASGFFGKVFTAIDAARGEVAVKKLHRHTDESDDYWNARKETLLHEAQNLVQAEHPNIVRVYSLVRHASDDTLHLVMEMCKGGSLLSATKKGPLPSSLVQKYANGTLLGLGALHDRKMLHRDIKPGNLLLDEHGNIKIGDFGLVTDDLILGYGSGVGYNNHMAPEIWEGRGTSIKSDMWAVGITLFRLLHGEDWYLNIPRGRDEVLKGGFASRMPFLPHITDGWRRVIRKAMHDDTQQRYQNATQFLNAVSALDCSGPDWSCTIGSDQIHWERVVKNRVVKVNLKEHSPKKHEWLANSYPSATGNRRLLGSGMGTKNNCLKELSNFFNGR